MKTVQFLSNSPQIEKISKGFNLSRSLFVSSLLIGEEHTGKKTFIQTLFPNSIYVDASNESELTNALDKHDELIIYNFEKVKNAEKLNFEHKRIVAIANTPKEQKKCREIFAFIYEMPKLEEREDLNELILYFQKEIQEELMIEEDISLDITKLDLTQNIKSLKASLHKQLLLSTFKKEEIQAFLYEYLFKEMEGNNAYREHLRLFEEPLIQAGLKKYKSQLKLAGVLGLNRNTLRKKIQEYDID
jgi:DNA-binding protein Fis